VNRRVIWWLCALVLTALVAPARAADRANVLPVFVRSDPLSHDVAGPQIVDRQSSRTIDRAIDGGRRRIARIDRCGQKRLDHVHKRGV
jgi:hypothetical protein